MAININAKTTGVGGLETSADNSGNINIQSGGSTVMSVTSSGVSVTGSFSQNGAVYSTQPSFRNLIINGDMKIAQRGTSATGLGNGDAGYHTVDRYRFGVAGTPTCEFTMSQDTDVPTGQGFTNSVKFDCTTADASLATDDYISFRQRIEAQNLQHLKFGTSSAEKLTLSFWVKSNKTGTYIVEFYQPDASRIQSQSYTVDSANTWEKKTITIDGDTSGTINNDNGNGIEIYFALCAGTNFTSGTLQTSWGALNTTDRLVGQVNLADSTSNNWYITGVQLEVGSTATEFEHLPYDVELARCQRYYEKSYAVTTAPAGSDPFVTNVNPLNRGGGTGAVGYPIYYRVTKRANPTVTPYTYDGTSGQWHTGVIGSSEAKGNATIEDAGTNYFKVVVLYSTTPNAMYGHWVSNAEL